MTLRYEKKNGIAYFIIDNGKVNVFNPQMHKDLYHAIRDFELDRSVRAGIMMGADGRSFSAGADLKNGFRPERTREQELDAYLFLHEGEGEEPSRPGWEEDIIRHKRMKPIIGAINGWCLGQGFIYLLALTDIRVAATDAKFGLPELSYGFAGVSATTQLARHLPYAVAAKIVLTGEHLDAEEARRIHLVNTVVPASEVVKEAERLVGLIALSPPNAVRVEMEALQIGFNQPRDESIQHGRNLYRLHLLSAERQKAGKDFALKKPTQT